MDHVNGSRFWSTHNNKYVELHGPTYKCSRETCYSVDYNDNKSICEHYKGYEYGLMPQSIIIKCSNLEGQNGTD